MKRLAQFEKTAAALDEQRLFAPIERKIFVRRRRPILQPIRAHVFSRREAGRGRAHMSRSRAPGDNGRHPGRLAADHTSAPSIHVRST